MATTEIDVLRAAIEQFEKPRGYTRQCYFKYRRGYEYYDDVPGPDVVSCCAVGGVEQAIWKLTGKDVTADRFESARAGTPYTAPRRTLYTLVMRRLNKLAQEEYGAKYSDGRPRDIFTIERLSLETRGKREVLKVFKTALAQAENAKRST